MRPTVERDEQALDVSIGQVPVLRYVFEPEMDPFEGPKPYLHPVRTLAGDVVTAFRPHDHRWHKGVQMTASYVSDQNFWGGGTYVRDQGYVDLPNVGTMRQVSLAVETQDGGVEIRQRLDWRTQDGERWLDESRKLVVTDIEDDSWALEFHTALTNVRGLPLEFGSPTTNGRPAAGYSGLFWRGPREFTGGEVIAADGSGGPEMMGVPARWLAYVGLHDEVDRASTVLFFDDPAQAGKWFVRTEPFPAVNPSLAFDTVRHLKPEETLDLRYRIVVGSGAWDRERLESYVKAHPW